MLGVVIMLITAAPVTSTNIVIAGGYKKSQAASLANDCGNGIFLLNVLCQNLESQIQGDGNAINVIGVQTGGEFELDKISKELLRGVDDQQVLAAFEWLKANGIDKEWFEEIDEQQLLAAFEWLKANGIDKEWFEEIDEQQLLAAFEWLKANGIDKELLSGSDTVNSAGYAGGFVLILVLFILLVIIGAGFGGG